MPANKHRLVLIGPQGSGKGTQGELLSVFLQIPTISTGQLCRVAAAGTDEKAIVVRTAMNAGELVSDELVADLLQKRLAAYDTTEGFILDGFPRNVAQAEAAASWMKPTKVLVIELDDETAIMRAAARRACSRCRYKTTANYVAAYGAVCPQCGAPLIKRADDEPAVIKTRLAAYHAVTQPVIDFYEAQNLVARFDGSQKIPKVFMDISEVL